MKKSKSRNSALNNTKSPVSSDFKTSRDQDVLGTHGTELENLPNFLALNSKHINVEETATFVLNQTGMEYNNEETDQDKEVNHEQALPLET